ncbi:hypothetical protein COCSUDRAFT_54555 [Coccomyxa subellipsoidea C-169]|uniref:Complex 1 LYR protein n=1 Tax=Coccomyxa subellipsoidea (strain C-169) TaxID=574566 RepID=I0YMI7_COCSC|nr:hypothetical protein COCSUDRAFT_54555 [Coccomyxa subellipsoidea C-169]EIE19606.1 hypothetical protein COCSUDRAFT_54555 [Coccomyxa subellipsoidea C-169]|eukprot:XP_005644150.1 hypothetical protein COCSUDRAFT_54555 [Coccomyxa subellipsoidea C-169]
MAEVRQVYRILLRTVRDRISSRNQNSIWHDYIVEEFHRNATEKNPAKVQELLRLAKDYAQLVQGVNYEKELLLSYNIGIDPEERQRSMIERTANLVGLQLPIVPTDAESRGLT